MSWLCSTASVNKIHELNCCYIYTIILILWQGTVFCLMQGMKEDKLYELASADKDIILN